MEIGNNALDNRRGKYVNPVTGGAKRSAGGTVFSSGGPALDSWRETYVTPVTTPKQPVPVRSDPVEIPVVTGASALPVVETDMGEERSWLDLQKDAFLYGSGKVGTGILGALEGANDFIGSTFYGAVGGLSDLVGADKLADFSKKKAASYLENSVTDDLNQKLEEKFKPTSAMQVAGSVNETVSGLLPSLAVGNVAGAAGTGLKAAEQAAKGANVSKALFGLTAAGGSAGEAKKEGATLGQALAYGAASGLLESAIEGIAGGIPGMGSGKAGQVAAKLTSNPAVAKILDIVGEGGEEALTTFVTPYLKRAMYDETAQNATVEEIAQSAAMGMIASGILQGGFELPGAIGNWIQNRQAGIIPGSGLDGTPAARDGILPVKNRTVTQATVDTSGQYGAAEGKKTASDAAKDARAGLPKITMADFTNVDSPIWNNVAYEDKETQRKIQSQTHREMVNAGEVVSVSEETLTKVAEYYPDLREMKKKERNPILNQKIGELKVALQNFLDGLKGNTYEFEVNGNILDAKLYNTGVAEVKNKITQPKASMIYGTEDIFCNARYLYSTPDYDGNPNVYRWNYFYTPVKIGEETVGVRIAIRDMKQTAHSAAESQIYNWGIKKDATLGGGSPGTKPLSPDASSVVSSNTTIPQAAPSVKKQYMQEPAKAFIPGSGLDGTPAVRDGMLPFAESPATQATPSAIEQAAPAMLVEANTLPLSAEVLKKERLNKARNRLEYTGIAVDVDDDTISMARRLSDVTGREILFYRSDKGENGYYSKDEQTIWVNVNSGDPVAQIISHELTHSVEFADAYNELSALVQTRIAKAGGDVEQLMQDKKDQYAAWGKKLDGQEAMQEVVAEYISKNLLTDEETITEMAQHSPTLVQKIVNFFDRLLARIGVKSSKERAEIRKMRDTYWRALQQAGAGYGVSTDTTMQRMSDAYAAEELTEEDFDDAVDVVMEEESTAGKSMLEGAPLSRRSSGVQYSIEQLPDGKKYVRADRQVIFGNDPDSWSVQLEDYINGKIRRGQDVEFIAEDGDVLVLTKDTAGKVASPYKGASKMSDAAFERKVNAGAHIDELAQVSTRGNKIVADEASRHGEAASNGWNYRTAFFHDFDGKYYLCTISVAIGEDGNKVYNIGKMQERSFPTARKALNGSSVKDGAQREKTSSGDRVPQSKMGVKESPSGMLSHKQYSYTGAPEQGMLPMDEAYWNSIMEQGRIPFMESDQPGYTEALLTR